MLETLGGAFDLLLVIVGFGAVIFIHELGHFLAAKWAGVRVHQFAIGFGSAACSWRKGLGFRAGSSEREYDKLIKDEPLGLAARDPAAVSPTEYRLNWIPFGGYVKMLGQEDADPAATSDAPDSYTAKPVWKRMVIISAGVVMNLVLAAALFVLVYMVGRSQVTPRIGFVDPSAPAARATLVSGDPAGTPADSLMPGDRVTRIAGFRPKSFNDISLEVITARGRRALEIEIDRPGVPAPLVFSVTPEMGRATGMLEIGVGPAVTGRIVSPPKPDPALESGIAAALKEVGLEDAAPGSRLISVAGEDVSGLSPLTRALEQSEGAPVETIFELPSGERKNISVEPWPILQSAPVPIPGGEDLAAQTHLLGLTPAVRVASLEPRAEAAGLRVGDLLERVGSVAWPDVARTIGEIRRHRGSTIPVTILRDGEHLDLTPAVDTRGTIGFGVGLAVRHNSIITHTPAETPANPAAISAGATAAPPAAARLNIIPGSEIVRVGDRNVTNFFELRAALRDATAEALASGAGAEIELTVRLPLAGADAPTEALAWALEADDVAALHALGWQSPIDPSLFMLDEAVVRTASPVRAMLWGLHDTHRTMVKTYVTFARLFQGTVKVEQLKGPVGIAHLGTQVVDRGFIELLFFLGLISVNLAVINFLPIPIADGGHFVMLLVEGATGKPVPPAVQNIATLAGLVLIVGVFVIVTFNDITNLFGG